MDCPFGGVSRNGSLFSPSQGFGEASSILYISEKTRFPGSARTPTTFCLDYRFKGSFLENGISAIITDEIGKPRLIWSGEVGWESSITRRAESGKLTGHFAAVVLIHGSAGAYGNRIVRSSPKSKWRFQI